MHPVFRELFIETGAEDVAAEEDWRRARRSQRARSAIVRHDTRLRAIRGRSRWVRR